MDFLSFVGNLSIIQKIAAIAVVCAGLVGAIALAVEGHGQLLLLLVILLVVAIVAYALFQVILGWWNKSKSKPMEKVLAANAGSTPQQVSEAKKLADLDSLRRVFAAGIEKFRAAGKDLYSLPWFVLVGQPGSGKTEAIRHSAVGFPPGLHDQLQGAGGTVNMNWWFTNHAVILDTAGRLMFEEVAPGTSSEWQEFLKLLRSYRPNCPINGMLLVIPAESLLTDSAEVIAKNAGKISQQLVNIQRTLGVRFPVFVLITKSDYLPGFSQFFDDLTDPRLQHQIMGWSNPEPLDVPFNVEKLDSYLKQVRDQLAERRGLLLAHPAQTEDPNMRRMDQMDTLYAFPEALLQITSRLKQYLEIIFAVGEWSAKPLFLRGIYFTSSLSEGKALDADLAQALGVSIDALPSSGVWRRDRAYFLRDLFVQKIFKEHGLVTRANNAKKLQSRRKIAVLVSGFAAVGILLASTFYAFFELTNSVGYPRQYWQVAAQIYTSNNPDYMAMIVHDSDNGSNYGYNGKHTIEANESRLADFYNDGFELVRKDIQIPWIFRPISLAFGDKINQQQHQAFMKIYNDEALLPIIQACESKLSAEPLDQQSATPMDLKVRTDALCELIDLAHLAYYPQDTSYASENSRANIDYLVAYVLSPTDYQSYKQYQSVLNQKIIRSLYTPDQQWSSALQSIIQSADPADSIANGIQSVINGENNIVKAGNKNIQHLMNLETALENYEATEGQMMNVAAAYTPTDGADSASYNKLVVLLQELATSAAQVRANLPALGKFGTLTISYLNYASALNQNRLQVWDRLEQAAGWFKSMDNSMPQAGTLQQSWNSLQTAITNSATEADPQFADLDQKFLSPAGTDLEIWQRQAMYQSLANLVNTPADPTSLMQIKGWLEEFSTDQLPQTETLIEQTKNTIEAAGSEANASYNSEAIQAALKALTLIESYRYGQAIGLAIRQAPADAASIESLVQQASVNGSTTPVKPSIPFTSDAGGTFNPAFDPLPAAKLLDGWYQCGKLLSDAVSGINNYNSIADASNLSVKYQQANSAFDAYRQAYFVYWLSTLDDGLKIDVPDGKWTNYLSQLPQEGHLLAALESLGAQVNGSLEAVAIPDSLSNRISDAKNNIKMGLNLLNETSFANDVQNKLNQWTQLANDYAVARQTLLTELPDKVYNDYIFVPSSTTPNFASNYICQLTLSGLRTLAKESQQRADVVLTKIWENPAFPLYIPASADSPQNEWSLYDLNTLSPDFHNLLDSSTSSLEVADTNNDDFNHWWSVLQGNISYQKFDLTGANVAAIYKILDAIIGNGAEPALTCQLFITKDIKQDPNNTVSAIWPYMTVTDMGAEQEKAKLMGIANFDNLSDDSLGQLTIPDQPQASLKLNFFETDPTVAGAIPVTMDFRGPWAALKLLVLNNGTTKDGMTWTITIHIQDQFHKDHMTHLEMIFSRSLPQLSDWPHEKE
ncbi:MAG TPA: type VI secretion protein IcmF/TssM N-terminal domain-containing protein [Phycisphaerae bacterium]|nr:type VI secretion protein IcmF/TssM N-terminal domain-containing protein [Phycisphaerae bacterium]